MLKAVIFDLFGVLVGRGFDETYRHAGGDPNYDHEFIEAILDQANKGQITGLEFETKIAQHIGTSVEKYEQAVVEVEQPDFELLNFIKALRQTYKTAILSNVNTGVIEHKIESKWLRDCFDAVILSAEVGFLKPQPEIYEYTAKKLGVEVGECVFIDDREGYVEAAQAIGMEGIVYRNFIQMKDQLKTVLADSNQ